MDAITISQDPTALLMLGAGAIVALMVLIIFFKVHASKKIPLLSGTISELQNASK